MSAVEPIATPPALSLQAWAQMMASLPPVDSSQFCQGFPFRIGQLPDAEKLWTLANDSWVLKYEQAQAQLARKQRQQGEVQDGVFYTPVSIAAYLVQRTLGALLEAQAQAIEGALQQHQLTQAMLILDEVRQLKVIDPACGTGIFLMEALKVLYAFYRKIQPMFPDWEDSQKSASMALEQLYGVDLDPVSVAITEFRLAQMACQWMPTDWQSLGLVLKGHFVCADTLKGSVFPEDVEWDFVLGNPPYVSEVRRQSGRLKTLQGKGDFYQAKMDLCDAFTAWGVRNLKADGQLAYVLPEYWTQRSSSDALRALLWDQGSFQEIWTFGKQSVFKAAPGHHTSLLIWKKQTNKQAASSLQQAVAWGKPSNDATVSEKNLTLGVLLRDAQSGKFLLGDARTTNLLTRLADYPPLLNKTEIQQGIVLPQGRLKQSDWQKLPANIQNQCQPDSGIFLFTQSEVADFHFNPAEQALLKPYYGPTGFLPFHGFSSQKAHYQLLYTDRDARRLIAEQPETYPALIAHLDRLTPILTSAFKPYGLHRPRQKQWFENPKKILSPRQVAVPAFAVVLEVAYVTEGFYSILTAEDADYCCALLNSKLAWFWFYHQKRKGDRLQIDKDVLLVFPSPRQSSASFKQAICSKAKQLSDRKTSLEDRTVLIEALNDLVYQAYHLTPEEVACVENAYQAIVISR